MFQEIAVAIIVSLAAIYLARTFWSVFAVGKSSKKCGGCAGACGNKVEQKPAQQLVQLQINTKTKAR
jgi:hypothetical protein